MPTSKLNTLANIADDRARRSAGELQDLRNAYAAARSKYDRLVRYARDYRDSAAPQVTPEQLDSRRRFELRIEQHIVALAEDLARRQSLIETLSSDVRDERASASALLALQARTEENEQRRMSRRTESQVDALIAARHVSGTRALRTRSHW